LRDYTSKCRTMDVLSYLLVFGDGFDVVALHVGDGEGLCASVFDGACVRTCARVELQVPDAKAMGAQGLTRPRLTNNPAH
jgi:hypothetical protein